jgi:hypothetical protein
MNCEQILAALETGDAREQDDARHHIRSCPSCAAAAAAFEELKSALAEPSLVTEIDRSAWLAAIGADRASSTTRDSAPVRRSSQRLVVAAAAVVLLVGAVALLIQRAGDRDIVVEKPKEKSITPEVAPERTPQETIVEEPGRTDPRYVAELDAVRKDVTSMRSELERLRSRAALLDVRVETNRLLAARIR